MAKGDVLPSQVTKLLADILFIYYFLFPSSEHEIQITILQSRLICGMV